MGLFFTCFASSLPLVTRTVMEIKKIALGLDPFANKSFFASLVLALIQDGKAWLPIVPFFPTSGTLTLLRDYSEGVAQLLCFQPGCYSCHLLSCSGRADPGQEPWQPPLPHSSSHPRISLLFCVEKGIGLEDVCSFLGGGIRSTV